MLKDRMTMRTRTRSHNHDDGTPWFKCRTTKVETFIDEAPDRTDVSVDLKEFYGAGTSHTTIDVWVANSMIPDVSLYDCEDGVYSLRVANTVLFMNRSQFEAVREAVARVS